jgi:hypothetical protein
MTILNIACFFLSFSLWGVLGIEVHPAAILALITCTIVVYRGTEQKKATP